MNSISDFRELRPDIDSLDEQRAEAIWDSISADARSVRSTENVPDDAVAVAGLTEAQVTRSVRGSSMRSAAAGFVALCVLGLVALAGFGNRTSRESSDPFDDSAPPVSSTFLGPQMDGPPSTTLASAGLDPSGGSAPTTTVPGWAAGVEAHIDTSARLVVSNANTVGGSAGQLSIELANRGFRVRAAVNSTVDGAAAQTIIYVEDGADCLARQIASVIGTERIEPMPEPRPVDDIAALGEFGVLIQLGDDLARSLETIDDTATFLAAGPIPDCDVTR